MTHAITNNKEIAFLTDSKIELHDICTKDERQPQDELSLQRRLECISCDDEKDA